MRESLLTSSVLILALLALRALFRERISRRVQYALWGLAALRLLAPVPLPAAGFSALSAAEPVSQTMTEHLEQRELYKIPLDSAPVEPTPQVTPPPLQPDESGSPTGESALPPGSEAPVFPVIREWVITAADLLRLIWWGGMAVMALWLGITNLRFWQNLRKVRTPYSVDGCGLPVYLVAEGLPSPCLFGLPRPAIYLTPAAVETPERLRHVLAHETAHARHGDTLWSLVRCLCLTIYWFDPLVWAAAAASKTDCELACDEAALRRLGPEERIPYGRTLLALIPVRRGPGSPLLSATTMTADKRRLRDRITRIAENRQTKTAALFLALSLTAVVCAVTFTGAKEPEARPLTGDELAYFNEEFFNGDDFNIHNQFLNDLYEKPEDIDLYELFYCGTGRPGGMSDEELGQVGSFDESGSQICPTDKLPVSDLDAVLLENTGLTLAETAGIGLEHFQYLPEYDAYYHTHGDTNYFHSVQIAAGERTGDTIRLYYPDSFARYEDCNWLCVTLAVQSDGSCWFVSNQPGEKPAIPMVYPQGEPALTIPLTDLTAYQPAPAPVERRTDDCAKRGYGILIHAEDGSQVSIRSYLSTDGNLYAAAIYDEAAGNGRMTTWDAGCFFTFPDGNCTEQGESMVSLDFFSDLLGHSGLVLSYHHPDAPATVHDYYYFQDETTPILLARAYGETAQTDLDGDGADELCASSANTAQIFFRREDYLHEADVDHALENAWPEAEYLSFNGWDVNRRNLSLSASVPIPDSPQHGTADRWIYFDGENLLVYRDGRTTADHVMEGAEAPEDVMEILLEYVQEQYAGDHEGLMFVEGGDFVPAPLEYDDWRIESIKGPYAVSIGGLELAIWNMNYELHTTTPESVILAGGKYMTEDCWVSPGYPGCDYFYFQLNGSGNRTYLYHSMANDCVPGSELFFSDMAYRLREMGLLSFRDLTGRELLDISSCQPVHFFNTLAEGSLSEQSQALAAMAACVTSESDPTVQELYDGIIHYMAVFSGDLTTAGRVAYEGLLAILDGQQAPPSEAELRAAILDRRASATAYCASYATEAHHVLELVRDGDICTVYLMVYYSAYDRTPTGWQLGADGQFPGSVTFVYRDGGWAVQEYWEPLGGGRYAPDLYANFPPEAAEAVLNNDDLWSALRDRCAEQASAYFEAHPVSADPLETPAPPL